MNKLIKLCLCIIVIIVLTTNRFAESTIRLANGEWEPYLSEHLKHYGIVSHVVSESFAFEGVKVKYDFFPWARSLMMARRGKMDGTLVWFYTPDRERDFYFSVPVVDVKFVFFHLKSFPFNWETIDDLKDMYIGLLHPTKLSPEFEKALKEGKLRVDRVSTVEQNFDRLLAKRIDLVVTDINVGYYIINKYYNKEEINSITHHPKPVHEKPMYLLLSKKAKKNKRIIQLFNQGIKELKEDGRYNQYFIDSRKGEYLIKQNMK